ncbi:hypothetical protein K438DRAFT_542757 [Mycena galopus ATCC 62051]|nr:hypothetical protein K438DRAFT_542757 [Mycena galopus ATCC 62051]
MTPALHQREERMERTCTPARACRHRGPGERGRATRVHVAHSDWSVDSPPPAPIRRRIGRGCDGIRSATRRAATSAPLHWAVMTMTSPLAPIASTSLPPTSQRPRLRPSFSSLSTSRPSLFTAGALTCDKAEASCRRRRARARVRVQRGRHQRQRGSLRRRWVHERPGEGKAGELAVDPVPAPAPASAFTIDVIDANKALFAASGSSVPGAITNVNVAQGLRGRGFIDK